MANTVIQLRKSSTPSAIPASLEFGELAINYADGKLYYKNTNSQIAEISGAGGPGGDSFGTVNANGVLIIADTTGDVLTLEAGQNITIVGDAINDKVTISATGGDISPAFNQANTASNTAIAAFNAANTGNNFLGLNDTPGSYSGFGNYLVAVSSGETQLGFVNEIQIDELVHTARLAPANVSNDSVTVYVTASGVSPNREVAYKVKNELGEEIIISSILV